MTKKSILTYIINLPERRDRKENILNEFNDKSLFNIKIIDAIRTNKGALGLWYSIENIIHKAQKSKQDKVIICEDDHIFTGNYSTNTLIQAINEGDNRKSDIVCGGVSWFQDAIQVSRHLYWTNKFSGTQFMIVYRRFFDKILFATFDDGDSADYMISSMSDKIFFIYPFISIQKDFGYSDITTNNNNIGVVENLFAISNSRLELYKKITRHYARIPFEMHENLDYENISIPTYVINLKERTERLKHIKNEFDEKFEFDFKIIDACRHDIGAVGLWMTIRKIIKLALQNNEDVIIICEDDHQFTNSYSWNYLLKNIMEAYEQGVDYLSGGVSSFSDAVPVSNNRYWVYTCQASQFIIIYRKLFQKILDMPFDDKVVSDLSLSNLTINKMVLYPPVSIQKDFGYSDVTQIHNKDKGLVQRMFSQTNKRFESIDSFRRKKSVK